MLSIVIPVYNNFVYTRNCLNNLCTLPIEKFEIIIVDNASTDQTKNISEEFVKLNYSNFLYLRNNNNAGFGAACNRGINHAKGDAIIILNNDIKFGSDFKNFFLSLEENILNSPQSLVGPTGGYIDKDYNFMYETNDSTKKINYMSGWLLGATKETWNNLKDKNEGPFDDKTFWLYWEDTDLSFSAKLKNIKFSFISCPLIHIGKQTSKMVNTYTHYTQSREKFIKKWKSKRHLFV